MFGTRNYRPKTSLNSCGMRQRSELVIKINLSLSRFYEVDFLNSHISYVYVFTACL